MMGLEMTESFTCCICISNPESLAMCRGTRGYSRSGPDLSSLTLETTNALLSPLGSHRECCRDPVSLDCRGGADEQVRSGKNSHF